MRTLVTMPSRESGTVWVMGGWAWGPVFRSDRHAVAFERFLMDVYGDIHPYMLGKQSLQYHYRQFRRLPIFDCPRCGEPTAMRSEGELCSRCRHCSHCDNDDLPLSNRGDFGWLCSRCTEGNNG